MSRQLIIVILIIYLVSTTPAFAGTFRDDFENEQDFLKDKQLLVGGVWGGAVNNFVWEDGAIKGSGARVDFFYALITGDYGWEDYTVECRIKLLRNQGLVALVLRRPCLDCVNPLYFLCLTADGQAVIYRNGPNAIAASPFRSEIDRWYSVKAIAQGRNIEFHIDGTLVVEVKDDANPAGKTGFAILNSDALFDDFVMTGPEVEDGGHWDPAKHLAVKPKGNLVTTWGTLKQER